MPDFEFVGFGDCQKILIEYTQPGVDRLNRLLVYTRGETFGDVRITGDIKPGIQPGDLTYFTTRIYNRKIHSSEGSPYSLIANDLQCPIHQGFHNYESVIDLEDIVSISGEPGVYPFNVSIYQGGASFYDAQNNWLGDLIVNYGEVEYTPRIEVTCEYYGNASDGTPLYTMNTYSEIQYYLQDDQISWFYSDAFGNPIEEEQTEIKVWEKDENDAWVEKKSWLLNGNRLPLLPVCEAECEEDCIPLYDATETYKICLCEPRYNDARDTTFPNLDADSWPMFE